MTTTTIGNQHDAWAAYAFSNGYGCDCCDVMADLVGSGEARQAWMVNGVVYKIAERPSANRHEHTMLTQWREAGASWAPPTSLYGFTQYGDQIVVLAMPYLPDDGGAIDPATLAAIKVAAPETCPENYVSHNGQTYLIDGGDIAISPEV